MQKFRPHWPRMLIVVAAAAFAVMALHLDIQTIGSKFGVIPSSLPLPQWPHFSFEKLREVLPDAATIALLAGIESLLSAVVADGMTGRRHRSNAELVAQGVANIVTPFFGGLPATGAIARTATNIRAGSTGPVSGILHAVFLLLFIMVAAPLASYIPLCVLAVILAIVAWNMSEVHVVGEFISHATMGDRFVLLTTMACTVLYDLTLGIEVGVVMAAFKFMHNMANLVEVETNLKLVEDEMPDVVRAPRPYFDIPNLDHSVVIYRIHGPFFFGAASELTATMGRESKPPRLLVLDFGDVPLLDSTGASALKGVIGGAKRKGTRVVITHASKRILRSLIRYGVKRPDLEFFTAATIEDAVEKFKEKPIKPTLF
jgi:SulP family sulfate permease